MNVILKKCKRENQHTWQQIEHGNYSPKSSHYAQMIPIKYIEGKTDVTLLTSSDK